MDGHAVIGPDVDAAVELLRARDRVDAPAEFTRHATGHRPDHRAAARGCRTAHAALPYHLADLPRGAHELLVLLVDEILIGAQPLDERLAPLDFLLHVGARAMRPLLLLGLRHPLL